MTLCAAICACPRVRKFAKDDFWIDAFGVRSIDVLWLCVKVIGSFPHRNMATKKKSRLGAHGRFFYVL